MADLPYNKGFLITKSDTVDIPQGLTRRCMSAGPGLCGRSGRTGRNRSLPPWRANYYRSKSSGS